MSTFAFGELRREYADLWRRMKVTASPALTKQVQTIIANRSRYEQVANATRVPWFLVGVIHAMEGSLNFKTHLHNGDPLTARTVQVPAGRPTVGKPPFDWEDSAVDALSMKNLDRVLLWSIERLAYQLEAYNGWGYRTRQTGIKSPYLWSMTNHYKKGKFVRDRVFDPEAVSKQIGAMALLRTLMDAAAIQVPFEADVPLPVTAAAAVAAPADAKLAGQPFPGVVIRLNHSDPEPVMLIQRRLNQLGMMPEDDRTGAKQPLDADGDFGQLTEDSVRLFQSRSFDFNGTALSVDGAVGPTTWAVLFDTKPPAKPASAPRALQPSADALLEKVIEIALAEEAQKIREVPLGSNRGPRVDEYIRAGGLDPTKGQFAWCVCFLVWCFDKASRELGLQTPLPRTAGVHDLWNKSGRAGFPRVSAAQARSEPGLVQRGQVFFIDSGGGLGHVGLVLSRKDGQIETLEGNTNNAQGREGIGVFKLARPIRQASLGFVEFRH